MNLLTDQFYEDLPYNVIYWIGLLKSLDPDFSLSNLYKKTWDLAKIQDSIPHLGNCLLKVFIEEFIIAFKSKYPDQTYDYNIDGIFSYLSVNDCLIEDENSINIALILYSN